MESQVQLRFANTQLVQGYMIEESRQNRVTKFAALSSWLTPIPRHASSQNGTRPFYLPQSTKDYHSRQWILPYLLKSFLLNLHNCLKQNGQEHLMSPGSKSRVMSLT